MKELKEITMQDFAAKFWDSYYSVVTPYDWKYSSKPELAAKVKEFMVEMIAESDSEAPHAYLYTSCSSVSFHEPDHAIALIFLTDEEVLQLDAVKAESTPMKRFAKEYAKSCFYEDTTKAVDITSDESIDAAIEWIIRVMPMFCKIHDEHMILVWEDLQR